MPVRNKTRTGIPPNLSERDEAQGAAQWVTRYIEKISEEPSEHATQRFVRAANLGGCHR